MCKAPHCCSAVDPYHIMRERETQPSNEVATTNCGQPRYLGYERQDRKLIYELRTL